MQAVQYLGERAGDVGSGTSTCIFPAEAGGTGVAGRPSPSSPGSSASHMGRPGDRAAAAREGAKVRLVQRRGGWHHQHILLFDHHVRASAGGRQPDPLGAGLLADAEALGRVLVGPDVTPFVEPAEFGIPRADQRRKLDAAARDMSRCTEAKGAFTLRVTPAGAIL